MPYKDLKKQKEYNKKYYQDKKITIAKQKHNYYLKNKNKILECTKQQRKIYRDIHKEEMKEYHKKYYLEHKEEIRKYLKKYNKLYKKEIRIQKAEYTRNRRKSDVGFRLTNNLRNRIGQVLKKKFKSDHTFKLLGCPLDFFINYYESKFSEGMSWEKVMNGKIHCDHIKPCTSFDLSKEEEQRKCFHYTNLQPLWARENLSKGSKLE